MLAGRDPLDAVQFTQRFCGVCPTAHAVASSQSLDNALGIVPTDNGRVIRNLIQGSNYIQSHILHFYHLTVLDFVRGPEVPPFVPRYEADYRLPKKTSDEIVAHYIHALHIRLKAHEMSAVFSGNKPHCASIVPGGVTVIPSVDKITTFLRRPKELQTFINEVYLPDVMTIAGVYRDYAEIGAGCRRRMSCGAFDLDVNPDVMQRQRFFPTGRLRDGKALPVDPARITEDVTCSWYQGSAPLAPAAGETIPDPRKDGAYTWLKAPRYDGEVYEVGPLARAVIARAAGKNGPLSRELAQAVAALRLEDEHLYSVLGRHLAHAVETRVLADAMAEWVLQIKLDQPVATPFVIPKRSKGVGIWDATPRDAKGQPGAMEVALVGTEAKDAASPFSLARIVRSFDPCIACAVHVV